MESGALSLCRVALPNPSRSPLLLRSLPPRGVAVGAAPRSLVVVHPDAPPAAFSLPCPAVDAALLASSATLVVLTDDSRVWWVPLGPGGGMGMPARGGGGGGVDGSAAAAGPQQRRGVTIVDDVTTRSEFVDGARCLAVCEERRAVVAACGARVAVLSPQGCDVAMTLQLPQGCSPCCVATPDAWGGCTEALRGVLAAAAGLEGVPGPGVAVVGDTRGDVLLGPVRMIQFVVHDGGDAAPADSLVVARCSFSVSLDSILQSPFNDVACLVNGDLLCAMEDRIVCVPMFEQPEAFGANSVSNRPLVVVDTATVPSEFSSRVEQTVRNVAGKGPCAVRVPIDPRVAFATLSISLVFSLEPGVAKGPQRVG
eukprot:m51a1_g10541 hypothetical protein (368) ;mRNA; f:13761-16018